MKKRSFIAAVLRALCFPFSRVLPASKVVGSKGDSLVYWKYIKGKGWALDFDSVSKSKYLKRSDEKEKTELV